MFQWLPVGLFSGLFSGLSRGSVSGSAPCLSRGSIWGSSPRLFRGSITRTLLFGLVGVFLVAGLFSAAAVAGVGAPKWDSASDSSTDDGYFELVWQGSTDDPGVFYKITEAFSGNQAADIEAYSTEYFVEGVDLEARRVVAGEYVFSLQACEKNEAGFPDCGKSSRDLSLVVTEAVVASLISEPLPPTVNPPVDLVDGGPGELRPGNWYDPNKSGHGWTFFWSNHLALPESNSAYGNSYDLVGIWYTYEAKHAVAGCSGCSPTTSYYHPLALRLKAVLTAANTYQGTLYMTRANGSTFSVGAAKVVFGSDNVSAQVQWTASFKKESLSDTDSIEFLHGTDPSQTTGISHLSGLWEPASSSQYYLVSDIGSTAEINDLVFHDSIGDPTWIQAVNTGSPASGSTNLCFGYIKDGYSPAKNKPSGWSPSWHTSGCNNASAASSSNRNGRRYFSSPNSADATQAIWAGFTLPGTIYAKGSLTIGSYRSPVALQKQANFHDVSYKYPSGSSCDLTGSAGKCRVSLSWFTDSYYPSATVFAYNKTTGVRSKVLTSTQPAMVNISYDVVSTGVFEFEFRMGSSAGSALMASSAAFTVTQSTPPPVVANPDTPPAPVGPPSMAPSSANSKVGATAGQFKVDETGAATYSIPIMNAPASGGLQPNISLDYSSLAGNGTMGIGWSLSGISAVTRCTETIEQDGISGSRAISITSDDRFCLDGQRLFLIPGSGSYGGHGSQYKTELDNFSRVTLYSSGGGSIVWFKVEHKDGSISQYGKASTSRIEARGSENPGAFIVWLRNRHDDRFGNYMLYRYQKNTSGPVGYMLTKIDYSGNSRAKTPTSARLIFGYSNRSANSDLAYSYLGGVKMEQRKLLKYVRLQGKINSSNSYQDMRYYDLKYEQDGLGRQVLKSLTECNSSSKGVCFPPTVFDWLKTENGITGSGSLLSGLLPRSNVRGIVLADVSGDGRPDLLYIRKVNAKMFMYVREAKANGTFTLWSQSYEITRREDGQAPPLMVLDADGDGLQDVVYSQYSASSHDYSWVALISTGSGFTSARKLHSSYRYFLNDEGMAPIAQSIDFNGDGLGDVLFSHTNEAGTTSQLSVLLNQSRTASNFGFSAPLNLNTDNADLFVISNGSAYEMRARPPYYTTANTDGHDHKTPAARVFDFNNDGAVDLLLKVSRVFEKCVENCQYQSPGSPGAGGTGTSPVLEEDIASFWIVMTSNGSNAFTRHSILAVGDDCDMPLICDKSQYQNLPKVKSMSPVDINADGLADLVWREDGDYWRFQLNTGRGFTAPALIARAPYDVGDLVRFEDWNGDGYPDLLYPSAKLNPNATWMVHMNHFGREFAGAANTAAKAGNVGGRPLVDNVENDSSIFADFTGDGKTDLLWIDRDVLGDNRSSRLVKGKNLLRGSAVEPANVITHITDGYGAIHTVTYKPMTDPYVYSRMHDSGNTNWGRGSVVYDLVAPIYLVYQASISAPRSFVPDATSAIYYHYVGAKMQAGGRGFLGFAEIISYDLQSKIRTNTRFRQDFPYIGMVADKMEAAFATSQKRRPLSNLTANTPRNWGAISSSSTAPSSPGGTRISYMINEWNKKTASGGSVFPYIADALERHYTLNGSFSSKGFTNTSYDSRGNMLNLKSSIYAADSGGAYSSQTTVNSYYPANISSWDFARVKTSNVTTTRSGTPTVTRKTAFEYDGVTAAVRKETKEPGHSKLEVITSFTQDKYGNQLSSTVTGKGMSSRNSSSLYDSLGRFSIQSKNALSQVTQSVSSWDRFGNALKAKNINGVEAIASADHMGRLFVTYTPNGDWSKTVRTWRGTQTTGDAGYCPSGTVFYEKTTGGGKPSQIKCFDLLQRETRTAKQTLNGNYSLVDQNYDSSGRIAAVSEPYFSGSPVWSNTDYDSLGRVTGILSAAGDDVLHAYDTQAGNSCVSGGAHRLRVTNGLGRQQVQVKNVLDESIAVYDANCGKISYAYDAQGNLTRITGADGEVSTMSYDLAGRKFAMNDPDKGVWQYAYNALGEMTRQLDPKGQAIDFVYDKLGRLTQRYERTDVSSLTDTSYTTVNSEITSYISSGPGKGQVGSVNYRNASGGQMHKKSFVYDGFGRPTIISTAVGGSVFAQETTYDQYGRLFQQFDASGDDHGLRYIYSYGHIRKIREAREGSAGKVYQHVLAMDARGNVTNMELGNGVDVIADYAASSGRLLGLSAYNAQGAEIQNVDYLFDVLGNLKHRYDYSGSANLKENYSYDALDRLRLVKLSVNNSAYATTLDTRYNSAGNITYKSDVGSYLYQASQPHAVSRAGNDIYLYDANGNQTRGDGRVIGYTVFDKPRLIIKGGKSVVFEYGVGNNRYQRKDYNGSTLIKTTQYLGNVERITKNGNTLFKRYLAGVAIADYHPGTGAQQISYLIKDHIGSIHTVLNEAGQIAATMHFSAFGDRQATNWKTPLTSYLYAPLNDITTQGFTGHEQIDDMGMIHMNGRTYDPKLGRFLQADPIIQAPKYSQSLNRYSYVMNNPLSFTDPTGYITFGDFFRKWGRTIMVAIVAAGVFYAAGGYIAAAYEVPASTGWVAATAGGISGAAGSAMMGGNRKAILKGAIIGAITAYVGNKARAGQDEWRNGSGKLYKIIENEDGVSFSHEVITDTSTAQIDKLFVNGQSNKLEYAILNASDQLNGAKEFFLFHNPTGGGITDTVESALGKLTNTSSISRQLANILQQNADTLQVITAHSQGTIIVSNAFRHLSKGTLSEAVTVNFNGAAVGERLFRRTAEMAGANANRYFANNFDFVTNVIGMGTANPFKIVGSILAVPLLFTPYSQHAYPTR